MKKIEAFVKPFTLESVKKALAQASIEIFHIFDAQELSTVNTYTDIYRGTSYEMDVIPRIAVVLFTEEENVERVIQRIQYAARTENDRDGAIIVSPVDQIIPISEPEPEPR